MTYYRESADVPVAVQDVTVQGLPAGLVENPNGTPLKLVWLAEDGSVAFILCGNGVTG